MQTIAQSAGEERAIISLQKEKAGMFAV